MPRLRILVLLAGDIFVLFASYLLTIWLQIMADWFWDLDFEIFIREEHGIQRVAIVVFTYILGMYFLGLYEHLRVKSRRILFEDLLLVTGFVFLTQALVSYSRSNYEMSRWMMLGGSAVATVAVLAWRSTYSILLLRVAGRQTVLFLGDTPLARTLAAYVIEHPERGYGVAGCICPDPAADFPGGTVVPPEDDLFDRIRRIRPDRIAVSGLIDPQSPLSRRLLECSMHGMTVEPISDLYEDLFHRVSIETLSLNQLVFSPSFRPKPWVVIAQEIYGRAIAAVGLLLTWPFMLVTALAVRLDSEGPVLLRQVRLGKGGVPFKFLKFRSMYVNADAISGPVRAKENDPRITRVGRWIRLTRLDELPQFINVLRGEMTLVGPRPEMPELEKELLKHIPLYTQRHRVKPGITGWAQIHHEPEDAISSTMKKLEYDLFYIKFMSPAMDFMTMFHTVKAVMLRIGAR